MKNKLEHFNKVHLDGTLKKTKKPLHFCKGLLLPAPSLGESYNLNAMVIYLTIKKTKS
jgi:hypothetical protein